MAVVHIWPRWSQCLEAWRDSQWRPLMSKYPLALLFVPSSMAAGVFEKIDHQNTGQDDGLFQATEDKKVELCEVEMDRLIIDSRDEGKIVDDGLSERESPLRIARRTRRAAKLEADLKELLAVPDRGKI